jgi:hypothetical protein
MMQYLQDPFTQQKRKIEISQYQQLKKNSQAQIQSTLMYIQQFSFFILTLFSKTILINLSKIISKTRKKQV